MNSTYKTVAASNITISELMLPSHTNFSGKIHGGYILSLLIKLLCLCLKILGIIVSQSVDTVDFETNRRRTSHHESDTMWVTVR
jgi:acyl-CoA hydrolase